MKFRYKITLSMISLVSILFAIGSSALISSSFRAALEREKESAYETYRMMLSTLQMVNGLEQWKDNEDLFGALEQIQNRSGGSWSGLQLSSDAQILYREGEVTPYMVDVRMQAKPGTCLITQVSDQAQNYYLQLTGVVTAGKERLYLDVAFLITEIYERRALLQQIYQVIFLILVLVCAVLAFTVSIMLTEPLSRLSKAAREIASGNLKFRTRIRGSDEIGQLAMGFDFMAEQVEESILDLKDTMDRQEGFMSSFAHEIKTPMTSVIGYADLLRGQDLTPEETQDAAQYIYSEGRRLESLSLKLLDILVMENQSIPAKRIAPGPMIRDYVAQMQPIYQKEGIFLSCECDDGVCRLDPDLFRSLLTNLTDNARKSFEKKGRILITAKGSEKGCTIQVSDTGKGIPNEALEHITEAFYRVDRSRSRAQGGVGLGLSLCSKIVALHQGEIRFRSTVGLGTCVTIVFPRGEP